MLEHHGAVLVHHIGPGRDIQLEGLGILSHDHVVQGVDALKDSQLVGPQLQRLRQDVGAHLSGELVLGHVDGLPPVQHGEVSVQQLDVEAEGRLVVDGALPVPGRRLRVDGVEVVVHGDGVGLDAHFLQLLFDLQCRGGLAGAGGAGQQDDAGLLPVIGNLLGRRLHFFGKGGVARLRKALGVRADSVVDLFQGIGHGDAPFTVLHKRRRRRSGWPATSPAAGYTRWDISR